MVYIADDLFIKILLFLLIFVICFIALIKIFKEKNKAPVTIISLSISLIAIYYLSKEQISFLELTYTLFGTIILMIIPFLIAFYFIYSLEIGNLIRKGLWIFIFGIFLIILKKSYLNLEYIPVLSTIIILTLIFLLVFDKSIKNKFNERRALRRH